MTALRRRSSGRFAVKAGGAILLPFAVQTALFAFTPRVIGSYPMLAFGLSISAGLLATTPFSMRLDALASRLAYAFVMFLALGFWTLFVLVGFFPANGNLAFPHIDL